MEENEIIQEPVVITNKIAFIIDGVVRRVHGVDEEFAAILLSNPTILDVTLELPAIQVGDTYEDGVLVHIEPEQLDLTEENSKITYATDADGNEYQIVESV